MKNLLFTLSFILLFGAVSFAQESIVNNRQFNQKARIIDGFQNGDINKIEAINIRRSQKQIRRMERRANADGMVTRRERKAMNCAQNKASKQIKRAKNN